MSKINMFFLIINRKQNANKSLFFTNKSLCTLLKSWAFWVRQPTCNLLRYMGSFSGHTTQVGPRETPSHVQPKPVATELLFMILACVCSSDFSSARRLLTSVLSLLRRPTPTDRRAVVPALVAGTAPVE